MARLEMALLVSALILATLDRGFAVRLCRVGQVTSLVPSSLTPKSCPEDKVCMLLRMEGNMFGMPLSTDIGDCMDEFACEAVECKLPESGGALSFTVTDCQKFCCKGHLCNDPSTAFGGSVAPARDRIPSLTEAKLRCHDGTWVTGFPPANSKKCDLPSQKCTLISSVASFAGIQTEFYVGQCLSDCENFNCSLANEVLPDGFVMESCKTECCDTDDCNVPTEVPAPTTPPTGPLGPMCFVGLWDNESNEGRAERSCHGGKDMNCLITRATYVEDGEDNLAYIGQCTPLQACTGEMCARFTNQSGFESFNFTSCEMHCCSGDLCNNPLKVNNPIVGCHSCIFGCYRDPVVTRATKLPALIYPKCTCKLLIMFTATCTIQRRRHDACCGTRSYNKEKKGCCGDGQILYNLKTHGCCGEKKYNMSKYDCMFGFLRKKF